MDLLAWLRFTLTHDLSNAQRLALLQAFGGPAQALDAPRAQVAAIIGDAGCDVLAKGASQKEIENALRWLEEPNHGFLAIGENGYPAALMQTPHPPVALYLQGRADLFDVPAFAIVGSRNATAQGVRDAEAFAHTLSEAGLCVVSGLALGIDAAAHRGGMSGRGSSIAVVGTGADRVYPPRNRELAHELAAKGTIVSEFPLGLAPLRGNFSRRNRIISGLSLGVLVVEAAEQSGSLITARFAAEQNRDVFAIPGSIHTPLSKGCHKLIKQGAKLVEQAEDILDELGIAWEPRTASKDRPDSDSLLDAMGGGAVSVDDIVERTGESASIVAARLTRLELQGRVAAIAGGLFQRLRNL